MEDTTQAILWLILIIISLNALLQNYLETPKNTPLDDELKGE